jgi:hypothetical protein
VTPLAKRLAIALVISVALNLLCIGFFVGRAFKGPRDRERKALRGDARAWHDPRLRKAFAERHVDMAARRDSARRARDAVREALRATPFDRGKLETALAELRAQTSKSQELSHGALVQTAVETSPEGRLKLARWFGREHLPGGSGPAPGQIP